MRARLSLALSILAGAFLVSVAGADPVGPHFEIVPFAGVALLDGDLKVGGRSLQDELYLGGRLAYQIHPMWAIEAAGGYSPTRQDGSNPTDVGFLHYSGNVNFTPWAQLFGGPFLFAGGGTAQVKPEAGDAPSKTAFEFGGGLRFWLTDRMGLRLEMRQVMHDDPAGNNVKINHLIAGGGLVFALGGKPRDTDGDGVPDRKDTCPDTPKGATVDAKGCTRDTDGDGVLDGLDQCEGTPKGATVDVRGCPSDGDGDGVFDGLDQCADTPKGASVDAKGCPSDGDGDGVFDGIDKCPDTSAGLKVDATGCPIEYIEKETELLDTGMIRLQDVNFETNKATLLPESLPALDVVGAILQKWPDLKIEVGGHTDSRGSNAHNQKLSEARAKSVLDYLTQKYPDLHADQFRAKGYGESKPLVPNTTDLNMARNRRVEFVVTNKDVLRKETERRRLLQKGETAPADTTKKE